MVARLPTIKSKESALRLEVKRSKEKVEEFDERLENILQQSGDILRLWGEFNPELISVEDVKFSTKKIAGVNTPVYEGATYKVKEPPRRSFCSAVGGAGRGAERELP